MKFIKPGDPFPEIGYRGGDTSNFHPRLSVRDILDYEGHELGNHDIRDAALKGIDWSKVPAPNVVWVTLKKKDALQYTGGFGDQDESQIKAVRLPPGSFVVTHDFDGGYLVHRGPLGRKEEVVVKKSNPGGKVYVWYTLAVIEGDGFSYLRDEMSDTNLEFKTLREAIKERQHQDTPEGIVILKETRQLLDI